MHRHNSVTQRKNKLFSSFEKLRFSKRGDIPGWAQVIALVLALLLLIFLIWLSIRSGKAGVDVLTELP